MFKALLLQSWHSLSDPELEEALRVRIDFMLFTGMGIENEVPDETTICRFRNKLVSQELDQELLEEINGQLELQGLKVGKATGAVIDASVIESAARPKSKKLKDGIMEKAYMGKPLTKRQKQKNRLISKRRHIVERGYVTMKRLLKFGQVSYIGLAKAQSEALRKMICFNLLKTVNKIKVYDWLPRKWFIQLQLM